MPDSELDMGKNEFKVTTVKEKGPCGGIREGIHGELALLSWLDCLQQAAPRNPGASFFLAVVAMGDETFLTPLAD